MNNGNGDSPYTRPQYALWQLHGAYSAGKRAAGNGQPPGEPGRPGVFYLAGSIKKNCWRHSIVGGLRGAMSGIHPLETGAWPVLDRAIFDQFGYSGPYFCACDHGCSHGPKDHGLNVWSGDMGCGGLNMDSRTQRQQATLARCINAIRNSDVVFAWIDKRDIFGTIFELGIACQAGKEIWIAGPHVNAEHWLSRTAATIVVTDHSDSPSDALRACLTRRADMRLV